MAMITCKECGRAISDRSAQCIGCGAPLASMSGFDLVPKRSSSPPPTRLRLTVQATLSAAVLLSGVLWANVNGHGTGSSRTWVTLSALVIICGLCGIIVTLLQIVSSRR